MTLPEELLATGADLEVRSPDPETDAIDGVLPGLIVAPRTPVAVAAALAWLSERRLWTVIRGNGTRSWGRPPARVDVSLETRHMRRVLSHRQGDLTATVEAGVSLADLNRTLAASGQWLPLDPPFGAGTIGGALATNDSGPQRHRFGTPRDLVIGIHLATCDGRLVKAGGQVVKNVA
ncbi:MAG: FAD-binding oxidoreductase, partial [Acidobacteria bacterium]|nr:FAD-binding oxidoreductase [Acidobacteriota bacterium]